MRTVLVLLYFGVINSLSSQPSTWNWATGSQVGLTWISTTAGPYFPAFNMLNGSALSAKRGGALQILAGNEGVVNNTFVPFTNAPQDLPHSHDYRSKLLVHNPSDESRAWLFSVEPGSPFRLVRYDLSVSGSSFEQTVPLVLLDSVGPTFEIVRMNQERDFWILAHKDGTSRFSAIRFKNGVLSSGKESVLGDSSRYRVIKSNLKGELIFLGKENTDSILPSSDNFKLCNFDTSDGSLSVLFSSQSGVQPYSAVFAPDSALLYVLHSGQPGANSELRQYRTNVANPLMGSYKLWESNGSSFHPMGMMQLGPDHSVYFTNPLKNAIGRITCPNLEGAFCDFDSVLFSFASTSVSQVGLTYTFVPDPIKSLPILLSDTIPMCQEPPTIPVQGNWDAVSWRDESGSLTDTPSEPGKYYIEVVRGCNTYMDSVVVIRLESLPEPVLPNVFTPNGDGINDIYRVFMPVTPGGFRLSVFTRWGNLIYSSINPEEGWDGGSGIRHRDGVYFVVLEYSDCNGNPLKKSGSIHLFRP